MAVEKRAAKPDLTNLKNMNLVGRIKVKRGNS